MSDHTTGTRRILSLLANKWTAPIIRCLVDGGKRPSELMVLIEGISQKMLIQTLRQMEQYGLVTRKVHAVVPPRVDYLLTPLGLSLIEALKVLWRWSQDHHAEIAALETRHRLPAKRDGPKSPVPRTKTSAAPANNPHSRARKLPYLEG